MEAIIRPEKRLGGDDQHYQLVYEPPSRHYPSDSYHSFPAHEETHLDNFISQSWIPEPSVSWSGTPDQQQWLTTTSASEEVLPARTILYSNAAQHETTRPYSYEPASKPTCSSTYQPCVSPLNHVPPHGADFLFEVSAPPTPVRSFSTHRILPSNDAEYPLIHPYNADLTLETSLPTWVPLESPREAPAFIQAVPFETQPETPFVGIALDWSTSEQAPQSVVKKRKPSPSSPGRAAPRRKHVATTPAVEVVSPALPGSVIEEYVGVFENAPGALATVKKRKKLDAPVRKAARDVRKAGACHQCRFRKRTCSTGTPCGSCLKNGQGLHEIKCQRESPFVGKPMHEYFEHSSTRRVVSFEILIPPDAIFDSDAKFVFVDGVGRLSHPVKLRARHRPLKSFNPSKQAIIRSTRDGKGPGTDDALSVMLLEDTDTLGVEVEQWAVEYASKFVHAAGPEFQSTTIAVILGTAYVKKDLPESPLVAAMLRVASIAFVLRAGVKCTTSRSQPSSPFRTMEATIDTILYQRLQLAEADFFKRLQKLVFRSAGYLTRQQVYPVALVFYQLLRILCIGASHLSNLMQRFKSKAYVPVDQQYMALKLVLSTHLALFRSSSPLLLDFSDKFNQDLLGGDKELLKLAGQMRDTVKTFREKGFPDLKGSIAYRKEYFELFRRVYEGL